MTTQRMPIDDLIRELLERRATAARPDGLLDEIVRTAALTPQVRRRGGWSFWVPPTSLSSLVGVAAIVIALVGAVVVAPRFLGPGATPTPDAYPTIVAAGLGASTLPAGRYLTVHFEPQLSFAVPEGLWAPGIDVQRQLGLRAHTPASADFEVDALTLVTISNVYRDPCTRGAAEIEAWDPSRGPAGFLDWFEAASNTELGPRVPVRILNSDGLEVEFKAPDLTYCARGEMPITDTGLTLPFSAEEPGVIARYSVITLRNQTVLVGTFTTDVARRDAVWAAADAVLESIEIAP
jgi:hypothetical protein